MNPDLTEPTRISSHLSISRNDALFRILKVFFSKFGFCSSKYSILAAYLFFLTTAVCLPTVINTLYLIISLAYYDNKKAS